MSPRGKEMAIAILRMCHNSPYKTLDGLSLESITKEIGNERDVKSVIKNYLIRMNYVREVGDKKYVMTELGKNRLLQEGGGASISFGDNTNFAYHSPGVQQTININDFDQDIREKVNEIHEAIKMNDKQKFKKALGYILDKGVDVSIALALAYAGVPR